MASAKKKRSTWYACYRDGTGRRRQEATSALTRAHCLRLAGELERKAERQRQGLEALPGDVDTTLGELCTWWLEHRCREASRSREQSRLGRHVIRTKLGELRLPNVTTGALDDRFTEMERSGLSGVYVNGLRRVLRTVFARARLAGKWPGLSPVELTEARPERRRAYETIRLEEVGVLLGHIPEAWRGVVAIAIFCALRKGEIFGLRKADVDLGRGELRIARSYDRDTTKGGREVILPIPAPLLPYLEHALSTARGELVFPGAKGKMRTQEADPHLVLRRALGRAGIVVGYDHVCRTCKHEGKPAHTWRHPDARARACPTCETALWPTAIPRHVRFHDLRHSAATILLRARVDPHRVQRICRHADLELTLGTYAHLVTDDLREAMGELTTPGMPAPPITPARVYPPRTEAPGPKAEGRTPVANLGRSGPLSWSGKPDSNRRPSAWEADEASSRLSTEAATTQKQYHAGSLGGGSGRLLSTQTASAVYPACTGPSLGASLGASEPPPLSLAPGPLLTVAEVAAELRVCRATVYALVARGELPHHRIVAAIRISGEDLAAYRRSTRR